MVGSPFDFELGQGMAQGRGDHGGFLVVQIARPGGPRRARGPLRPWPRRSSRRRMAMSVMMATRSPVISTKPSPMARKYSWPSLRTVTSPGTICVSSGTCWGKMPISPSDARERDHVHVLGVGLGLGRDDFQVSECVGHQVDGEPEMRWAALDLWPVQPVALISSMPPFM